MVTVPLRLVELSNHGRARMVGTLHQIAIGLGMISTIALSIPFAKGVMWRFILVIGLGLGVVLLLGGLVIGRGGKEAGARKDDDGGEEGRPLLAGRGEFPPAHPRVELGYG